MPATLHIGRWRDTRTARRYIAEGVQVLLKCVFDANQQQRFAALAQTLWADTNLAGRPIINN
eukprot:7947474-Pyramimonas_sp.AAC.1